MNLVIKTEEMTYPIIFTLIGNAHIYANDTGDDVLGKPICANGRLLGRDNLFQVIRNDDPKAFKGACLAWFEQYQARMHKF